MKVSFLGQTLDSGESKNIYLGFTLWSVPSVALLLMLIAVLSLFKFYFQVFLNAIIRGCKV